MRSVCLCLLSSGMKGIYQYVRQVCFKPLRFRIQFDQFGVCMFTQADQMSALGNRYQSHGQTA